MAEIHSRTLSSKDRNLKSLKPYSTSYREFRQSKGRGSDVNLTYTGAMLGAMTHKDIPNGLRFTFMSKSELDKAYQNSKTRDFFGVDKNQEKKIRKKLSKL